MAWRVESVMGEPGVEGHGIDSPDVVTPFASIPCGREAKQTLIARPSMSA